MNAIDIPPASRWTHPGRPDPVRLDPPRPLEGTWDRAEWQRLWLGTQVRPWRTLAVVAGDDGISTLEVATLISTLGQHYGESIGMVDARDLGLQRVPAFIALASDVIGRGVRLVFATRSIAENLATIPIARSADAVLLCVSLGCSTVALVEETVAELGKERFLGSLLLKPNGNARPTVGITPRSARLEAGS